MSRNKDAMRLAELRGIAYSTALAAIREECGRNPRESLHDTAVRLIAAEEQEAHAASS